MNKHVACESVKTSDKDVFCSIPWGVSNCPGICDVSCMRSFFTPYFIYGSIQELNIPKTYDNCDSSNGSNSDFYFPENERAYEGNTVNISIISK
jgi:hypothetical protein